MRRSILLCLLIASLVTLGWYWPNRAQNPGPALAAGKFASLSFAPFRAGQSPMTEQFPSAAEADADMALMAGATRAVRTYAAIEGQYDAAALAQKHGLHVWQGIWLGADRARNAQEIARGIALAHAYPDTITRVVVGNEVLLRRDLPPAALIAAIDQVRAAVKQPVAYADVWDFWKQFPEVAAHVDVMLIHLLPYWEDTPTGIDAAVAHVGDVYHEMRGLFPGKPIAIGETGWPSAGRARRDAVPSRVNAATFLRRFIALSGTEHFDYNFIEAFDQDWKYASEGRVGANWGVFAEDRSLKIPLTGPVSNLPNWAAYTAVSIGLGVVLAALGGFTPGAVVLGMALGSALGIAAADTCPYLYDRRVLAAAWVNLSGQTLLALLAMGRGSLDQPLAGARSLDAVRGVLRGKMPPSGHLFADVLFLMLVAAAVNQGLLAADSRYRDFPFGAYAVPVVAVLARFVRGARPGLPGREQALVGGALAIGALVSLTQEGFLNTQSLGWNACALILALGCVVRRHRAADPAQ